MNHDILSQAPKVVLHDHLDGGLRPETIIELAEENGYPDLPTTNIEELSEWFHRGANRRDLSLYLETFQHTVGACKLPTLVIESLRSAQRTLLQTESFTLKFVTPLR